MAETKPLVSNKELNHLVKRMKGASKTNRDTMYEGLVFVRGTYERALAAQNTSTNEERVMSRPNYDLPVFVIMEKKDFHLPFEMLVVATDRASATSEVEHLERLIKEAGPQAVYPNAIYDIVEVPVLSPIKSKQEVWVTDEEKSSVNHPQHYNQHPAKVECITVVRWFNFNVGNVIKYLWRDGLKQGSVPLEDLKKAAWYLNDEIERREGKHG